MADEVLADIYVYPLQTREPYFEKFEVELFDVENGNRLAVRTGGGAYNEPLNIWTLDGALYFEGLTMGTTYALRARVVARGGRVSIWSDWALETAGDSTGPDPTYAIATLYSEHGVRITVTPTPNIPSADFDHYEVYWALNAPGAPAATTLPTIQRLVGVSQADATATFDIPMTQADDGYAWIRAVDTSGNRQAWRQLHTGAFTSLVANVTGISVVQTIRTIGKSARAILTFQYTAPNDNRFRGVRLWMLNHDNKGKLEQVGNFIAQTIGGVNSFLAIVDLDYGVGAALVGTVAHNVTFYLQAYTTENIYREPVTSAPSIILNPGITGDYAGPAAPSNVNVFLPGTTVQLSWNDDIDPEIVSYNVYRQFNGNRASPTSPNFSTSELAASQIEDIVYAGVTGSKLHKWFDKGYTPADFNEANPTRVTYWVSAVSILGQESAPTQAGGTPAELVPNAIGENPVDQSGKAGRFNKVWNARFKSDTGAVAQNMALVYAAITAATNATPIQITVAAHGLAGGETVWISGVQGNAAANGLWTVTVVDANNLTLDGSVGSGAYTAGGLAALVQGQPPPPSSAFGVWTVGAAGTSNWVSNGASGTGEVDIGAGSSILNYTRLRKFAPEMRLTLSVYAKHLGSVPTSLQLRIFMVSDDGFNSATATGTISGSLVTTTYRRFAFCMELPSFTGFDTLAMVIIANGNIIRVNRPMLNEGDMPGVWTNEVEVEDSPGGNSPTPRPDLPDFQRGNTTIVVRDASSPFP